jgi:polyisoprenoid-binding protein YceI
MSPYASSLVVVAVLVLAGCDNEPAAGKPRAEVASAASTQAAAPASAALKLPFSAKDSKVEFVGAKVTGKHVGSFGGFQGTVHLTDGNPEKSSVEVEIDMASLTTDTEKLTAHLKGPDFFDVEKFPKAKFVSTGISAGGAGGASHTVTGNLELHGVKKSIRFPASIKVEGSSVSVGAEFAINRKDFGVAFAGMPDDLIKDDVLIKLTIRASKG